MRLSLAVAVFCAVDGPHWLGHASQRDYARSHAGISWSRFLRLRRTGAFLAACPEAADLSFSVVELLARSTDPGTARPLLVDLRDATVVEARAILQRALESEHRTTAPSPPQAHAHDADYERISFSVPASVSHYVHQTLQLAQAMIGRDTSEDDAVDAVVAEASSEFAPIGEAFEARAHFGVRRRRRRRPSPPPVPPATPPLFRHGARHAALVLDRWIRRLLDRERVAQIQLEDAVLRLHETEAYHDAGYTSLVVFAREVLDLPRSTLFDVLDRARARRRYDPIAIAYAGGEVAAVKAQLLERFQRGCHVPPSCLRPWIDAARQHTVRELKDMLEWARTQRDTDYRGWSNAGFPPPSASQVRTSVHPIHEIATDPTPEILADVRQQPTTRVQWTLRGDTLDLLLQLMMASQHSRLPDVVPPWWALLDVFVTARRQWSVLEREPSGHRSAVLRRDDYRCVVPDCSERRSLQVHHLHFRSAGGQDQPSNLVTLCAFHHRALHDGRIRIRGQVQNSARDLVFELGIDEQGRARQRFHGERRLQVWPARQSRAQHRGAISVDRPHRSDEAAGSATAAAGALL